MDRLVDMMDEIYTTVVLGDFNFVKECRDRRGGVVLNGYDRVLGVKFNDKMGGWGLQDVFNFYMELYNQGDTDEGFRRLS